MGFDVVVVQDFRGVGEVAGIVGQPHRVDMHDVKAFPFGQLRHGGFHGSTPEARGVIAERSGDGPPGGSEAASGRKFPVRRIALRRGRKAPQLFERPKERGRVGLIGASLQAEDVEIVPLAHLLHQIEGALSETADRGNRQELG